MVTPSDILLKYWGYQSFRPLQEEIIAAVLEGNDTLALLPTGGGKSICFQVPALLKKGICIVITPLISLMKDQVDALNFRGVKARALYSGMSKKEIDITLDNCIYGEVRFLYVSPERLKTEIFLARTAQMNISLIAVDEAHCVSQWGYDFRPSYLEIAEFKRNFPGVPCIALTATATPEVQVDLVEKLELKHAKLFKGSFERAKLSFSVRKVSDKDHKLLDILEKVPGSAIVYVNTRKGTRDLSAWLNHNRISADFYHAGLTHDKRQQKQDDWIRNKTRVMVSTNAFGMGIDKPDVRLVVHYELPSSLEAYYQEAGRAGRDNKIAYAVVLFQESDKMVLERSLEKSHPAPDFLRRVYQAMANYLKIAVGSSAMESYDFDINEFCSNFGFNPSEVFHAIQKLREEGLIDLNESFYHPSKFIFNTSKEKVYEFQIAHEEYDVLIKAMLRLYGGESFSQFTSLSERQLSKYLNASTFQVTKKLETLHKNGIIFYDKIKDIPQLTFLTQRYDAALLPLSHQRLSERKTLARQKLKSMAEYVEDSAKCRMKMLCRYFGEELKEDCGKCDVCLSRNRKNITSNEASKSGEKIKHCLAGMPKTEKELVMEIKTLKSDQVVEGIKYLLDRNEIYYDRGGKLHLAH